MQTRSRAAAAAAAATAAAVSADGNAGSAVPARGWAGAGDAAGHLNSEPTGTAAQSIVTLDVEGPEMLSWQARKPRLPTKRQQASMPDACNTCAISLLSAAAAHIPPAGDAAAPLADAIGVTLNSAVGTGSNAEAAGPSVAPTVADDVAADTVSTGHSVAADLLSFADNGTAGPTQEAQVHDAVSGSPSTAPAASGQLGTAEQVEAHD